jgi:small redox-active disulfide protein 2
MMTLEILGMGCAKCQALAERTEQAARELGLPYRLEKVTDIGRIAAFRVMSTPALVIDGSVQVAGRVPTVGALKELLSAGAVQSAGIKDRHQ